MSHVRHAPTHAGLAPAKLDPCLPAAGPLRSLRANSIRLRKAGATPKQIDLVLRFAHALIRAKSEDKFCRSISLIVDEFKSTG